MSANWAALTSVGSITMGLLSCSSSNSSVSSVYCISGRIPTFRDLESVGCCRNCSCISTRFVFSGRNLIVRERIPRSTELNKESCVHFQVPCALSAATTWICTSRRRCTCIASVSVEMLNLEPRKALNGTRSLYRSAFEWTCLSTTNSCDFSAKIHVAYRSSLVTRWSSLSHSREQHFTYWRWVFRDLSDGLLSWYFFADSKSIVVKDASLDFMRALSNSWFFSSSTASFVPGGTISSATSVLRSLGLTSSHSWKKMKVSLSVSCFTLLLPGKKFSSTA